MTSKQFVARSVFAVPVVAGATAAAFVFWHHPVEALALVGLFVAILGTATLIIWAGDNV